jgi:hypothetical protein
VETLNDPIRLRALGLGPAVIDVLDGEIEFVLVAVVGAAAMVNVGVRLRRQLAPR